LIVAKDVDWDSVEVQFRAGVRPLRAIAGDFDITEAAIRQRAKKHGWVRNPASLKRERVNAQLAAGSQEASQETSQRVACEVDREVQADVEDMERGVRVNRLILEKIEEDLPKAKGFKTYKAAAEASKTAIENIRRIRGLDAPMDLGAMTDEQLAALAKGKAPA